MGIYCCLLDPQPSSYCGMCWSGEYRVIGQYGLNAAFSTNAFTDILFSRQNCIDTAEATI